MLITKETDYALRVLRVLSRGDRRSVPELSEEEQLPVGFTYKIVGKLAAAGILSIARGVEGGCLLQADLQTLTLYDVMAAMGDTGRVSACMDPAYPCPWRADHSGFCSVHCHLSAIQTAVYQSLKQYTVAALLTAPNPSKARTFCPS